jgi:triosephosphate isomerase (TIM)
MVQFLGMSHSVKPLIIGNWKMNPRTSSEAVTLAKAIAPGLKKITDATVVIAPPALYLGEVAKAVQKSTLVMGAQYAHPDPVGARTGDVSGVMLAPYGVQYVIVGHSERRAKGETDADVVAQVTALLKQKMIPVVCVGERTRDDQGTFFALIEAQIKAVLAVVPKSRAKELVIAYEPIWAIGTGATATPQDVEEMRLFINKVCSQVLGRTSAAQVRIIYGGSVSAETAASLYTEGGVAGFLVGGASLRANDFLTIIKSTQKN